MIKPKYLALFWTAFILALSLTPGKYIPKQDWEILAPDTLAHIVFYLVLSVLYGLWFKIHKIVQFITVFAFCFLYGMLIEILQESFITDRYFDYYDVISNAIGSAIGLGMLKIFFKIRQ